MRLRARGSPRRKAPSPPGSAPRHEGGPAEPCLRESWWEAEESPSALPAGGPKAGTAPASLAAAGEAVEEISARASLCLCRAGQALRAPVARQYGSVPCGLTGLNASAVLLRAARAAPVRVCACVRDLGLALLAAVRSWLRHDNTSLLRHDNTCNYEVFEGTA